MGDPCQLPPILADLTPPAAPAYGLGRTLFERLAAMGTQPLLLRTCFRSHPALCAIPNDCFYGGRLRCAVSAAERPPLLPSLAPLVFLDVRQGREQKRQGGSSENAEEAAAAARVVSHLLQCGVPAASIGVIAFYHAQVAAVTARLMQLQQQLQQRQQQRQQQGALAGQGWLGLGPSDSALPPSDEEHSRDAGGVTVSTVDSFQAPACPYACPRLAPGWGAAPMARGIRSDPIRSDPD